MKVHLHSLIWVGLPLAGRLNAAVPLFDFEQPADVVTGKWHSKAWTLSWTNNEQRRTSQPATKAKESGPLGSVTIV